jgi:hypothetical protein
VAYISQERKAKIAAELRRVIPIGWKYSLSVRNPSTLYLTIWSAPVDLIGAWLTTVNSRRAEMGHEILPSASHCSVNEYYLNEQFRGELLQTFEAICEAMNAGNHDRSDLQTDYFDVGWYTEISIGRWNQAFQWNTEAAVTC